MRIAFAVTLALGIAAAVAQKAPPEGRRARGPSDGGTPRQRADKPILLGTDPPGRLRPWPDAGPAAAQVDAGVPAVERELQQLRARVDALERERAQLQEQSSQLQQVVQQLQELRAQIAQGEDRRQASEQQQAARQDAVQGGISALQQAQQMLAGGDSAVDAQLAQAQGSFPPQAQKDLEAARTALRNRDLGMARTYISAAISDAQQGR